MTEKIKFEQHVVALLTTSNPVDLLGTLRKTILTYPLVEISTKDQDYGNDCKKVYLSSISEEQKQEQIKKLRTYRSVSYFDAPPNTDIDQKEYLMLLETFLKNDKVLNSHIELRDGLYHEDKCLYSFDSELTTMNKCLITDWIKEQKENHKWIIEEQPKEETTSKPNALTTKQQFLLLDLLGVLERLKEIENTKKSELLSKLLGKDSQNIRNCFTYYGNKNSSENPLYNSDNPTAVINLLEKAGFGELAEKAREKYKNSLSKMRKDE